MDPTFFPKAMLRQMIAAGVDIGGMEAQVGSVGKSLRGTIHHNKWDVRDPVDNKIVVPYTFHADFPETFKNAALAAWERMNSDLGCVKTVYVPEEQVTPAGAP